MGYAQDLVNQGYGGYQGWGDAEAKADYSATGGAGKKTSPSSPTAPSGGATSAGAPFDFASFYKTTQEAQKAATQPAIDTLTASKMGISSAYDPARASIADEYDKLLTSVKGQTATNVSRTFGARGIPLSSGMVGEAVAERTKPIEEQYTASKAAELSRMDLANINQLSGIDQLIAQLQSGGGSDAINRAIQLLQLQNQAGQSATEQAWKQKVYKETTLPESQYAIKKPYYQPQITVTNPFLTGNNLAPAQVPASPNFKPQSTSYGSFGLG